MFDLRLQRADHVRRYFVRDAPPSGWEVRFEEDYQVRRQWIYQDWHRVERALALFEREVNDLRAAGWRVAEVSR
jgi:hypothetical protein